jgi:ubiquinone/menaquinone biosynthesis C-methylase UbiE
MEIVTSADSQAPEDPNQFKAVASVYDHLMQSVPYADWVVYLRRLLETRAARPRRILDLACGTGNVTELLAEAGYSMTGVDIAADMITEARRKAAARGQSIAYHVQDAGLLDLPGERFDLCISLFDSLNYITDPAHLQRAFERVALHLTRNGLFIFDLNSDLALREHFFDQSNLKADEPLRYDWRSDYYPETRLCRVHMQFWAQEPDGSERYFEEDHWQYAYTTDEIKQMLATAGFEDINCYQAYTLRAVNRATDRIFYVARKSAGE